MAAKKITEKEKSFHRELIEQSITLSTSAFGLAAALAWNETIQQAVKEFVEPSLPAGSGILSRLIYALIVTLLAVLITYQLSRLAARWGLKK